LALIRRLLDERPTYGYRRIRRGRAHPVYAPYTEHVPPDVTAAIFWLKNRDPQHWRDSQQLEQPPMTEEQWIRDYAFDGGLDCRGVTADFLGQIAPSYQSRYFTLIHVRGASDGESGFGYLR
jgi:hypothetical protein